MEVGEESDGREEGDVLRNQFARGYYHWKKAKRGEKQIAKGGQIDGNGRGKDQFRIFE